MIEKSGSGTEKDAKQIMMLYLEVSIFLDLTLSYAERNTKHSTILWELLMVYCLNSEEYKRKRDNEVIVQEGVDGMHFGCLLKIAANLRADLAHLVSHISKRMRIISIRPKLLSAISNYKFKRSLCKAASTTYFKDKVSLLHASNHRSRHGLRVKKEEMFGTDLFSTKKESSYYARTSFSKKKLNIKNTS